MKLSRCSCCSKICVSVVGKEQIISGLLSKLFSLKVKISEKWTACVCFKCYLRLKLSYAYHQSLFNLCRHLRKPISPHNFDVLQSLSDASIISHCPICFTTQPSIQHIYQHLVQQQCQACGYDFNNIYEHYGISPKCVPTEEIRAQKNCVYHCAGACGASFERRQLLDIHQKECHYVPEQVKMETADTFHFLLASASDSPTPMDQVETGMLSTPASTDDEESVTNAPPIINSGDTIPKTKRNTHLHKARAKNKKPTTAVVRKNPSSAKQPKQCCPICSKWVHCLGRHLMRHNLSTEKKCKHCHKVFHAASRARVHEAKTCPLRQTTPQSPSSDSKAAVVAQDNPEIEDTKPPSAPALGSRKQCCPVCGKWVNKLREHLLVHNANKEHQCKHCNKMFTYRASLKRHEPACPLLPNVAPEELKKEPAFTCDVCSKSFSLSVSLKQHMKNHIKFPCTVCNAMLSKASVHMHMMVVHEDVSSICDFCGKVLKNRYVLQAHIRKHHRDESCLPACEVCGKKFKDKQQLKMHGATHDVGRNELSCETCGLRFFNYISLQNHIRSVHKKATSRECSVCGLMLSSLNTLKVHERQHTGVKPYTCDICGKAFTQRPPLNRHKRTQHGIMPALIEKCPNCDKMFPSKAVLKSHMVKVH